MRSNVLLLCACLGAMPGCNATATLWEREPPRTRAESGFLQGTERDRAFTADLPGSPHRLAVPEPLALALDTLPKSVWVGWHWDAPSPSAVRPPRVTVHFQGSTAADLAWNRGPNLPQAEVRFFGQSRFDEDVILIPASGDEPAVLVDLRRPSALAVSATVASSLVIIARTAPTLQVGDLHRSSMDQMVVSYPAWSWSTSITDPLPDMALADTVGRVLLSPPALVFDGICWTIIGITTPFVILPMLTTIGPVADK